MVLHMNQSCTLGIETLILSSTGAILILQILFRYSYPGLTTTTTFLLRPQFFYFFFFGQRQEFEGISGIRDGDRRQTYNKGTETSLIPQLAFKYLVYLNEEIRQN